MFKVIYCLNALIAVGGFQLSSTQKPNGFEEVVAIQVNGVPKCLGAIVSDRFIATAAHCVYGVQASRLKLEKHEGGVKRVIIHPYYKPPSPDYDIALLKTNTPCGGSCLPLIKDVLSPNTTLTAFDWDPKEKEIKDKTATLEDRKSCRAKMANRTVVSTRMLCVNSEPVMDGSPLVYKKDENNQYIVGVGWHYVGGGGNPKIFTNIANSEIWSFIERYTD